MQLSPDDDVYRFEPRWIDLKGWLLPVTARYVVWAAWFAIFFPLLVLLLLFSPLGLIVNVVLAVGVSAFVTYTWVADRITPENSIDAVTASFVSELKTIQLAADAAKQARREQPVKLNCSEFLNTLETEQQPTKNPFRWFRKD